MNIITTERKNDSTQHIVVVLNGRITAFHAPTLREQFTALFEEGVKYFVLDLSEVEFLDSAGLAALVNLLKQAKQEGGNATMILPKLETAQRILRLTRFDKVFPIASSVEEALQSQ